MDEKHNARIQLTDDIGILMTYPTMDLINEHAILETGKGTQQLFKLVSECMYQVWEGDEVHDAQDYNWKEKMSFLESLTHDQFGKIQEFFETMPRLQHDIKITNPKTKVKSTVTLRGIQSFFE
jgi:hypothetical protein